MPLRPITDAYFRGLEDTYGFAVPRQSGPALARASDLDLERRSARLLSEVSLRLPGPEPDLYVGPLFGMAPAATIAVEGRPAIAIGADKFDADADRTSFPRRAYHPDELVEMIPHEAAHVVRMQALGLPPTPRALSLLDMALLEGTALLFTDLLVGKMTLSTFLPPPVIEAHRAREPQVLSAAAREWNTGGMPAFLRWFSEGAWPNGYYIGYALCRRYYERYGHVPVTTPSTAILAAVG